MLNVIIFNAVWIERLVQPFFLSVERDTVLLPAKNIITMSQKAIRLNDVRAIFSGNFSRNESGEQNTPSLSISQCFQAS